MSKGKGFISQKDMCKQEKRTHNRIKRNIAKVREVVGMGATMLEVAQLLNISKPTLYHWRKKEPRLEQAIQEGWTIADQRVNESITKLILGGQQVKEESFVSNDGTESKRIVLDTKNPSMEAIRFFDSRMKARIESQKARRNKPITRDDLQYLSDEDLLALLDELENEDKKEGDD